VPHGCDNASTKQLKASSYCVLPAFRASEQRVWFAAAALEILFPDEWTVAVQMARLTQVIWHISWVAILVPMMCFYCGGRWVNPDAHHVLGGRLFKILLANAKVQNIPGARICDLAPFVRKSVKHARRRHPITTGPAGRQLRCGGVGSSFGALSPHTPLRPKPRQSSTRGGPPSSLCHSGCPSDSGAAARALARVCRKAGVSRAVLASLTCTL